MPSFSISRIGTYETCPLQYKYSYIDKIRVEAEDTIETFLGSRVHEALERLYRDVRHEKLMSVEELVDYYNELWKNNWKDSVIIVKKEYTEENYRKMGERQLTDYYKRHHPFYGGKIIGLETTDYLPLDEDGEYKYHIRIDRLMDRGDGLYEVHDYKTGSKLPKQEELDQDRQLAMYSLWVKENFKDFKKVRLVWHMVAFDKEMDSFRTEEQLEDLKKEIIEEIKKIEAAEEFPANVSWLCEWCLYKTICPMWKHGEELEEKPENEYLDDPGLKLVEEYARIKGELDGYKKEADEKLGKIREALITFCQREGVSVVFGFENKVSVKEQEYTKFPRKNTKERQELVDALKEIGRFSDVSELDVHALAKVFQKKEWGDEELEVLKKFETTEIGYRLSVSKK